ncbi:MAG: methyltransferase [Elusimicrobia bacterium]|nr:methyltransferase [Elusimicrobiota bacterium]
MNKKMSVMGVGGKIAVVLIISLAVTAGISFLFKPMFRITENSNKLFTVAVAMIITGFILNLIAAFSMLNAYGKEQLATGGLYSIFLNPMYTFQILVTVPGLLLFFNSWFVMITIISVFIAFKVFVKKEEKYLEEKFGNQYKDYKKKVLFKFL